MWSIGFEYWANPSNRDEGFITWQVNGSPSIRLGASSMGADQGTDGSQVSQRPIPEEPMVSRDAFWNREWCLTIWLRTVDYLQLGYLQYVFCFYITYLAVSNPTTFVFSWEQTTGKRST